MAVDLVGLYCELLICGLEEFGFTNIYTYIPRMSNSGNGSDDVGSGWTN